MHICTGRKTVDFYYDLIVKYLKIVYFFVLDHIKKCASGAFTITTFRVWRILFMMYSNYEIFKALL